MVGFTLYRPALPLPRAVTPALLDGLVKLAERQERDALLAAMRGNAAAELAALFPIRIVWPNGRTTEAPR